MGGTKKPVLTAVERLQELSLVKKVSEEMGPHLNGLQDATLSEFVVSLAEAALKRVLKDTTNVATNNELDAAQSLRSSLAENGAPNLPLSLCSEIIQLVLEKSPRIERFWEKLAKKEEKKQMKQNESRARLLSSMESSSRKEELAPTFPGLAKANLVQAVPLEKDFYEHRSASDRDKASARSKFVPGLEAQETRSEADEDKPTAENQSIPSLPQQEPNRRRRVSNLPAWMTKRDGNTRTEPPSKRPRTDELNLYEIYRGTVKKIMDFGITVELKLGDREEEGIVYNSQLSQRRINNSSDAGFRRGQSVWVKVISLGHGKVVLSAKDADQESGRDLMPHRSLASSEPVKSEAVGSYRQTAVDTEQRMSSTSVVHPGLDVKALKKREDEAAVASMLNSQMVTGHYGPAQQTQDIGASSRAVRGAQGLSEKELWEAQLLIRSGVLPVDQYPTFDAEGGMGMLAVEETEEETEVELAESEPAFLRGQTSRSGRNLEPVKIVKNPDGSLQRAALQQATNTKERRELRRAQQQQSIDIIPKDMNKPWEDPLPEAGERHFASVSMKHFQSCLDTLCSWILMSKICFFLIRN